VIVRIGVPGTHANGATGGLDEYFAECVRAYADVLNDPQSPWPRATRERLHACDFAMHAIVAEIFGD